MVVGAKLKICVTEKLNEMKKDQQFLKMDSGKVIAYEATMNLRYAQKSIPIDEHIGRFELTLQQMWRGTDGSEKWEWVEEVQF